MCNYLEIGGQAGVYITGVYITAMMFAYMINHACCCMIWGKHWIKSDIMTSIPLADTAGWRLPRGLTSTLAEIRVTT